MAKKPFCNLKVANKLKATQIVARTILPPKSQQPVDFFTEEQLKNALVAEKRQRIKIIDALPEGFSTSETSASDSEVTDISGEENEESVEETAVTEEAVEESKETEDVAPVEEPVVEEPVVEESENEEPVQESETEEVVVDNEEDDVLSDSEIDGMTKKQIRKYIEDKNLDVDISSGATATEHKEALKAFYAAR